jgi:hypothetical protein
MIDVDALTKRVVTTRASCAAGRGPQPTGFGRFGRVPAYAPERIRTY